MTARWLDPSDSSLFARPSPKVRAGKKKRSCLSAARRSPTVEPPVYQPTCNEHDVYPRVRTGAHKKAPECRRPGSHRPMGRRAGPRELQKRHHRRKERCDGHPQGSEPPVSPSLPSSLVQSLVISKSDHHGSSTNHRIGTSPAHRHWRYRSSGLVGQGAHP